MKSAFLWLLLLLGAVALFVKLQEPPAPVRQIPRSGPLARVIEEGYAGRAACESCHRKESQAWGSSPHGQHAIMRAEPLGGADLAVGSVWMQAYLKRDAAGYHRIVSQCWDLREERWRPVTEVLEAIAGPRGDRPAMTQSAIAGRDFDTQCAGCHTSGPTARIDLVSGRFVSGWRDAAIDCEACHGPGLAHADSWRRLDPEPVAMVRLEDLETRPATTMCARCHGGPPTVGDFGLEDAAHFVGTLRTDATQTADGTSLGQGYQYAGFVRSPCFFEGGLSCSGCHDPHGPGLRPMAHIDALCARCHEPQAGRSHHHHPLPSEGARCINCHMPQLLDGVMAHQRDHRIGSPLPHSAAVRDACTACHTDRDKAWARKEYERLWGAPPAATLAAVEAIAAAEAREGAARSELLAAQLHRDPWIRARAGELLDDPERLLADPVAEVRLHGLYLAGRRADPDALLALAAQDPEARVRGQALSLQAERAGVAVRPTPAQRADLEVFVRQVRGAAFARVLLGQDDLAQQRFEQAIEHLTYVLGLHPERSDAWRLLARAYEGLHELDNATLAHSRWAESHARALASGRLSLSGFQGIVGAEVEAGRRPLARLILESAVERLPPGSQRSQVEQMLLRLGRER